MNTKRDKKNRELQICERLARKWNELEGSDYYPQSVDVDPPDCLLVSGSRNLETREVEVTTDLSDYILRQDNRNALAARRELEAELNARGICNDFINLDPTEQSLRSGLSPTEIRHIADIYCGKRSQTGGTDTQISGVEIWRFSPGLAEKVHGICGNEVPELDRTHVFFNLSTWESDSGPCIAKAIEKKSSKYQDGARSYDLAVGCAWHITQDSIMSYGKANPDQFSLFRTIWVVTEFDGVFRIK